MHRPNPHYHRHSDKENVRKEIGRNAFPFFRRPIGLRALRLPVGPGNLRAFNFRTTYFPSPSAVKKGQNDRSIRKGASKKSGVRSGQENLPKRGLSPHALFEPLSYRRRRRRRTGNLSQK